MPAYYNMRPRVTRCGRVLNSSDAAACYKVRPHVMHMRCWRMSVNVIWFFIYFHTKILRKYSLWIVNSMNIYLLFNSDFVNHVWKSDGGGYGVWEWGVQSCHVFFLLFFSYLSLSIPLWCVLFLVNWFWQVLFRFRWLTCFSVYVLF